MLTFHEWLENQAQQMIGQAELDKSLHDKAIKDRVFPDPRHMAYLIQDKQVKTDFQQIVADNEAGRAPDPGLVQRTIRGLEFDLQNHRQYMQLPPDPKTGDHSWHANWAATYEQWLKFLKSLV